jgi:hypothetical protein
MILDHITQTEISTILTDVTTLLKNTFLHHAAGHDLREMLVQPSTAATVCEFEPALETGRVMQFGSDRGYRRTTKGFCDRY